MLIAQATLQGFAAKAEAVSPWWFIAAAVIAFAGLVFWNWSKVKAAFQGAMPEVDAQIERLVQNARNTKPDPSEDQIGQLKNGFALLLELDRYNPTSMTAQDRDAQIVEGVKRLLQARSEASK